MGKNRNLLAELDPVDKLILSSFFNIEMKKQSVDDIFLKLEFAQ